MANTKITASFRGPLPMGKQAFLPPKCPIPTVSPSYGDYGSMGSMGFSNQKDGQRHHQRTSSESFLIVEQPPWLDDLLNEPETPMRRGAHHRSSSDSFVYLSGAIISPIITNLAQDCVQRSSISPWEFHEFDKIRDTKHATFCAENDSLGRSHHRGCESMTNVGSFLIGKEKTLHKGVSTDPMEPDIVPSDTTEIKRQQEPAQDLKCTSENKEGSLSKQPEIDLKRAKQQFAQRSRFRKLQYIAELERNFQVLQAEGFQVSAELEFLDRQNLMLNLENKALKQRLDNLAQEQIIKHLQQEMLEREVTRLRILFQQQQQQLQKRPTPAHGRGRSRNLGSQFANLTLKHEDKDAGHNPVTGPIHIEFSSPFPNS